MFERRDVQWNQNVYKRSVESLAEGVKITKDDEIVFIVQVEFLLGKNFSKPLGFELNYFNYQGDEQESLEDVLTPLNFTDCEELTSIRGYKSTETFSYYWFTIDDLFLNGGSIDS